MTTAPTPCICPGLLFFTTYTLLVLFWAEIYHQARSMPTGSLRPMFVAFNVLVYAVQVRDRASRLLVIAIQRRSGAAMQALACS